MAIEQAGEQCDRTPIAYIKKAPQTTSKLVYKWRSYYVIENNRTY